MSVKKEKPNIQNEKIEEMMKGQRYKIDNKSLQDHNLFDRDDELEYSRTRVQTHFFLLILKVKF